MIGRLAFLFERNFSMLYREVRLRLNDLNTLTNVQAQDALTQALVGAPSQVRFESEQIEIVTVGTLCGGTCSGTFLDFGYLLRRIVGMNYSGLNINTDSRAIFTLPSSGGSDSVFASNAYAALTELDYYSDTVNVYRVKHPDISNIVSMDGMEPYERQLLVEAPGIAKDDIDRLNDHIAQYLFGRIMFQSLRQATDAVAINAKTTHFENLSSCGAPQRYFTFGMASLEYPTTQIRRACSARLAAEALGAWLAPLPAAVNPNWLTQIGLEESAVITKLLDKNGGSVISEISGSIRNFCKRGENNPTALYELANGLPNVFDSTDMRASPLGDVPPGSVLNTVRQNGPTILNDLKRQWQVRVEQNFGAESGDCRNAIDRTLKEIDAATQWLEQEIQDLNKQKNAEAQESAGSDILAHIKAEIYQVENCSKDGPLAAGLWKGAAIRHHVQNVQKFANRYVEARQSFLVKTYGLLPLYEELRTFAREIKDRIDSANPTGIQQTAMRLQQRFEKEYLTLASTIPNTPGVVLFTPKVQTGSTSQERENNTVDQAYLSTIANLGAQEGAFQGMRADDARQRLYARLIKRWVTNEQMDKELFRQPVSDYDVVTDETKRRERMEVRPSRIRLFEEEASGYFTTLLNRSIADEVSANKLREELPEVNREAELLLSLNPANPCYEPAENKSWRFLFHPSVSQHPPLLTALSEQVAALHITQGAKEYSDVRRISIVEEHCAFPLGSLTSLSSWENGYRMESEKGRNSHARADITFAGIVTDLNHKKRLLEARQLFIVSVALEAVEYLGMGAAQPYEFKYVDAVGSSRTKRFSEDCRQAAYAINDAAVHSQMRKRIASQVTELTNARTAEVLQDFIRQSGAPEDAQDARNFRPAQPLKESGKQLTALGLYDAIEGYLSDHLPPVFNELRAVMGDDMIRHYESYRAGETFSNGMPVTMDGIYCPICHQRLAPYGAEEKNIPSKCSNCGHNTAVRNR